MDLAQVPHRQPLLDQALLIQNLIGKVGLGLEINNERQCFTDRCRVQTVEFGLACSVFALIRLACACLTCLVTRGMTRELTAAVRISDLLSGSCAVMPWLEWCPDPQQPEAQWVKVFHPQGHHVEPPPRHTYREWKLWPKQGYSREGVPSTVQSWHTRDWPTEGFLNLNRTLLHFFTLIITAGLHSHHSWTCPRNCSGRSYDHLMRQSSPSRISPVCRRALASSLLIECGKHLGLINLYALQMRPSNFHPNPKYSQNLIRLPAPCSLSIKGRPASKWCCHVDLRACHLSFVHDIRITLWSHLDSKSYSSGRGKRGM